jgi:hypothetical protein
MTPDNPYRSAPRICRTHNRMFIVYHSSSASDLAVDLMTDTVGR